MVAGAPPDGLSAVGQLWGNPLYDWSALRAEGYRWWIERLRRTFELVDVARIDHFRGFVSYWAVPTHLKTAKHGRWRRGPGADLFRAAERELGPLPIVAENLGVITKRVEELREQLGIHGMLVMQFAYGGPPTNPHRLENHARHSVVYTGTHDCDTALGWWGTLTPRRRRATGLPGAEPHWELIDATLLVAGRAGDRPGPGRARPGQRGADEHARDERGQLALAAAPGPADQAPRRPAPGGHRGRPGGSPLNHRTVTAPRRGSALPWRKRMT